MRSPWSIRSRWYDALVMVSRRSLRSWMVAALAAGLCFASARPDPHSVFDEGAAR